MNSDMVKPEKFGHLHLVYHFTVPLSFREQSSFMLSAKKCTISLCFAPYLHIISALRKNKKQSASFPNYILDIFWKKKGFLSIIGSL